MIQSILEHLDPGQIQRHPFPHIVVENLVDPAVYTRLAAEFPSLAQVAGSGALDNNHAYRLGAEKVLDHPDISPAWRAFFANHTSAAFFAALTALWREDIEREHPGLEQNFGKPLGAFTVGTRNSAKKRSAANENTDVVLDCLFGFNSPVRRESSVRGPHVDSGKKLYSALWYFRAPEDDSSGGAFEFYGPKKQRLPGIFRKRTPDRYVERVKTLPYQPNTLVIWLNTWKSLHGVTPRSVTDHPRRYISFTAECYGGRDEKFFTRMPARAGR